MNDSRPKNKLPKIYTMNWNMQDELTVPLRLDGGCYWWKWHTTRGSASFTYNAHISEDLLLT